MVISSGSFVGRLQGSLALFPGLWNLRLEFKNGSLEVQEYNGKQAFLLVCL